MSPSAQVAVLGAGSIGVAFAVVFARAGHPTRVWDPDAEARDRARGDLDATLRLLAAHDLLEEDPGRVAARVSFAGTLPEAVGGAVLVQECAPERLELKRDLFAAAAESAPAEAILASSSSAIPASRIGRGLPESVRSRLLVGHPGNPPFLLPVIEVVPSPETSGHAVAAARGIYSGAGLRPILVRKEIEGFVFNRLQGAVLREAYALVRDGIATVDEIDEVVRSGLGRRWSFIGPFETVDLNTRGGLAAHAERMGPAYERMGAERGQHDPWTPELVAEAVAQRRAILPLAGWADRVRWRDEQLMRLTAAWDSGPQPSARARVAATTVSGAATRPSRA